MNNEKICLLGVLDEFYTKVVATKFQESNIPFNLILVSKKSSYSRLPAIFQRILGTIQGLYSGRYLALSKFSFFTYKLYLSSIIFNRSAQAKELRKKYMNLDLKEIADYIVPDINHVAVDRILAKEKYSIGILAGVGIVHEEIINGFSNCCLNAHPAPLPECRGGGAIQFTLYNNYEPSASVHYATPEIDAGSILKVSSIPINKQDSLESLALKLTIHCAEVLAETTLKIKNKESVEKTPNHGSLNYWKDCSKAVQKKAIKNLEQKKRQLKLQ